MPTPEAGFDARRALQEFERLSELSDDACTQALAELAAAAPALAAEVRALLVADAAQGLLDRGSPMALIVEQDMEQARVDRSGEVIGAYQLIARIGRGGMGDVYRASRDTDGFRQIVALKLLRRGLDTGEMVRRFVQERRILARLEPPGIARMIDGGLSHDGLPWLAMELIDGLPITEFARRAGLSLRARIELVLAVCDAVDYAHRRLIVHRDLKPSNVLVTPEATPRLLDFGIAKLLDQDEDGTLTGTGMHLLSPVYAAPEQFSGEPVGITTDVYALGLMLYELLTETLPQQRRDTALAALHQAVLSPPAPPSSVFAAMTDRSSSLSVRALVGDLDTITLKALALEPDRRYASAAALADDLRRYLDGHPIAARPDTLSYRVGKFVRRHRGGVSAAAISLIALIAGFGFALWQTSIARDQALRADTEARRAEIQATRATEMGARTKRVKNFLMTVFQQEDPLRRDRRGPLTMAQAFDDALNRIDHDLADDPSLQGDLLDDFGEILSNQGEFERAEKMFQRALAIAEKIHGPNDPAVAESLINLAVIADVRGQGGGSKALVERAVAILEAGAATDPEALANAYNALGNIVRNEGDLAGASKYMRRALDLYEQPGSDPMGRLSLLYNLAIILIDQEQYAEAEPLIREAITLTEETQGVDAAPLTIMLSSLEQILVWRGALDEEFAVGERRVAIARKHFKADHPWLAGALAAHGWQIVGKGNWQQGEALLDEGIAMFRRLGDTNMGLLGALRYLGVSQARRGDVALAFATLDQAYAYCRANTGANKLMCATIRANRAHVDAMRGNGVSALAEADLALAELRERFPRSRDEQAQALVARAAALFALSRFDEAVAVQHQVLDDRELVKDDGVRNERQATLDKYVAAAATAKQ